MGDLPGQPRRALPPLRQLLRLRRLLQCVPLLRPREQPDRPLGVPSPAPLRLAGNSPSRCKAGVGAALSAPERAWSREGRVFRKFPLPKKKLFPHASD